MSKTPTAAKARSARGTVQRQAILDAASLLFIEKGFGGTNINDIADAVGMTRTALYYYFPSKESVLEALTKEVTERASELTNEVAQRSELPPDEALRLLILRHAGLILAHPLQFRVAERSESSLPESQRRAAQAARRAVRDDFVNVIRRGIGQGVFRAIDADPNQYLAVMTERGAVVGTLQLTFIAGLSRRGALRGQIEAVRVAASRRGAGLGQELFEWAIAECRARGCRTVQLTTDRSRADAHRFYERLGFVASHVGYKLAL